MKIKMEMVSKLLKILVTLGYCGDYNVLRKAVLSKGGGRILIPIYKLFCLHHSSYLPLDNSIKGNIIFPHLSGIFISNTAIIGKNNIIYQHVTIGSTYIGGSKKIGSPTIGDNCVIGAGAKIIGKVTIGNNCKIGANCVIVDDIPDNCTVVLNKPRIIKKTKSCVPDR
ncbi:MAG: serine acetyltransferase [Alistipes sp.]|nr:serine acetyltransferase [Alistipes sp.]